MPFMLITMPISPMRRCLSAVPKAIVTVTLGFTHDGLKFRPELIFKSTGAPGSQTCSDKLILPLRALYTV